MCKYSQGNFKKKRVRLMGLPYYILYIKILVIKWVWYGKDLPKRKERKKPKN